MPNYQEIRKDVLKTLEEQLPEELTYHGIHHTMDVLNVCNEYIEREGLSEAEAFLLRVGALYHDLGFIRSFEEHEKHGADMAQEKLPAYGLDQDQIEVIKGLIMATKVPQSPKTDLEMILCDADLDYLGRDDFYSIGRTLYEELRALDKISDEKQWNQLQLTFLNAQKFHTDFARLHREPEKQKRIAELKALNL